MKFNKILLFAAAAVLALASCSKELGTEPGSESAPKVTFYQYAAPEGYNQDESLTLRLVPNGKVSKMYLLTELKSDKTAFIEKNGEEAYVNKVVENGSEMAGANKDIVISDLQGLYAFTVVAESENGNRCAYESTFKGIKWVDAGKAIFIEAAISEEQGQVNVKRVDDANRFKIENPCGQIGLPNAVATNYLVFEKEKDGDVTFFDIPGTQLVVDKQSVSFYYYDPAKYADYCTFESTEISNIPSLVVTSLGVVAGQGYYTGQEFALVFTGLEYVE